MRSGAGGIGGDRTGCVDRQAGVRDPLIGDVHFQSSNGWTFIVFSDGGEWDYIHRVSSPSGEELKVWPDAAKSGSSCMLTLSNYRPPVGQSNTIWRFMD